MSSVTTLPFIGGELSSFDPWDSLCFESASQYDASFARCAICILNSSGCDSPTWTAASDFNFHAQWKIILGASVPRNWLSFWNGTTEVCRIVNNNTTTFTVYTLQSGVLTSVGTYTASVNTLNVVDIRLIAGGSGSVNVYMSGTNRLSVTGLNHTGFSGVTQVTLRSGANDGGGNGCYWSQIICDTIPHVGDDVKTIVLDADSATNTGFTGSVTSIDELLYDDTDFIYAGSSGLVSTFYKSGLSLGTLQIQALGISARAKCGVSGPQHLQICLKASDGNHFSSSIALDIGYQACAHSWTADPATSAAWVTAAAAATEGGAKSVT